MYPLFIFLSINILFYSWITVFNTSVPFEKFEYLNDANHYIQDPRIDGKPFSLVNALGQYDGQWYLRIADKGYPYHPQSFALNHRVMNGLLYNFFPLYPLCIIAVNLLGHNVEISAFIFGNLLLLASVYSLYFVVSKWYSKKIALKTILLVLIFPFSVFLRGYYAEGLRLLLFIWFCYGLTSKKYLLSAMCAGLLSVTSGISLLLLPFYYGVLWFSRKKQKITLQKLFLYGVIAAIPFLLWMFFCYMNTENSLIFVVTRSAWFRPPFFPPLYNILLIILWPSLPLISFYGSRMDVTVIIITLALVYLSQNVLPKVVWLATIVLAFSPLLVQDSISFARFVTVLFPLFVYLAVVLKKQYYILLVCIFIVGLLFSSLFFVNWYWIE